jgi:quercetin dioxygenase-like cupin family protein
MQVVKVNRRQAELPDRPHFSGTVHMQHLVRSEQDGKPELLAVFFDPGARTIPHVHSTDQVLHILEGEGIVATEHETRVVNPGDIAIIPAGTWHWHGATRSAAMCHLSIKVSGPSRWDVSLRDWETNY